MWHKRQILEFIEEAKVPDDVAAEIVNRMSSALWDGESHFLEADLHAIIGNDGLEQYFRENWGPIS